MIYQNFCLPMNSRQSSDPVVAFFFQSILVWRIRLDGFSPSTTLVSCSNSSSLHPRISRLRLPIQSTPEICLNPVFRPINIVRFRDLSLLASSRGYSSELIIANFSMQQDIKPITDPSVHRVWKIPLRHDAIANHSLKYAEINILPKDQTMQLFLCSLLTITKSLSYNHSCICRACTWISTVTAVPDIPDSMEFIPRPRHISSHLNLAPCH